jgi:hypothetical protein
MYEEKLKKYNDYFFGCQRCPEHYVLTAEKERNYFITPFYSQVNDLGKTQLPDIPNCDTRRNLNSQECAVCSEDFLLKTDDFTCILKSSVSTSHPNCLTLTTLNNQLVCDTCDESHSLDLETHLCSIENHCAKYLTDNNSQKLSRVCTLCEDNYHPDENADDRCIPVDNKDDVCLKYSAVGMCVSCKDSTLLAVNEYNTQGLEHSCVKYDNSTFAYLGQDDYEVANAFGVTAIMAVPSDENINWITAIPPVYGYPMKNVCVSVSSEQFCSNFSSGKCVKCNDGHFLDKSSGQCLKGRISFCAEYIDMENCKLCEEGFYKNNQNKCVSQENILTGVCVASKKLDSPKCIKCAKGYFYKNGKCVSCSQEGCIHCSDNTLGTCLTCKSGYQMKTVGICQKRSSNEFMNTNTHVLGIKICLILMFVFIFSSRN